jgi:hypothetical protein
MEQVIYECPGGGTRCDAWFIWNNGDVTFLMVPSEANGVTLTVAVARDIDADGVFHKAEGYWLSEDDQSTLQFARELIEGTSLEP